MRAACRRVLMDAMTRCRPLSVACPYQIIQPVVQRRSVAAALVARPPALALRPVGRRRAGTMVSSANGWRWPHDPQRSGLAARSAVAVVTVLARCPVACRWRRAVRPADACPSRVPVAVMVERKLLVANSTSRWRARRWPARRLSPSR